jgi:hypothetical protein
MASWDVWKHGLPPIELHGQEASLRLPDPNWFAGDLLIAVLLNVRENCRAVRNPGRDRRPNTPIHLALISNYLQFSAVNF